MEDLIALMVTFGFLALIALVPVGLLLVPLKVFADVSGVRRRLTAAEEELDELKSLVADLQQRPAIGPPPVPSALPSISPVTVAPVEPVDGPTPTPDDAPDTPDTPATPDTPNTPDPEDDVFPDEPWLQTPEEANATPVSIEPREAWKPPSPEKIAVLLGASIGGIALLIGLVLGLVAVLDQGWFGPAARVSGGMVFATFLWVVGAGLRGRLIAVPSALAGAGMGTMYGSLFAAHSYYGLLPPTPTFFMLILVSFVAGLRATVLADRFMAYMGLFGGLLAPIAVSTGQNGAVGLFAFLFLLSVGTLTSASKNRWPDLVGACMFGTGAIYVGWTGTWLAPDSVTVALVSAFALAVPYAVAAVRAEGDGPADHLTRWTAGVGALMWMPLAIPWVFPVDTEFIDPQTGIRVLQRSGMMREVGLAALCLLPVPAWLAARKRESAVATLATSVLALALVLTWGAGWANALDTPDLPLMLAPLGPLLVGLVIHTGARRTGVGLSVLLVGWTVAIMGGPILSVSPEILAGSLVAATVLALAGSYISTTSPILLVLLGGASISLALQAGHAEPEPNWVAGSILFLLGAVPFASLASTWSRDRLPPLGWMPAVLAGIAMFPASYLTWVELLGSSFIGALPVLLGLHSLLVAAVLVRVRGQRLDHPMVMLAIMLVLAGITFALPIQVQEKWLTVGWALEALALAWLATRIRHPFVRWASTALAVTVAVRLLANPWALGYGSTQGFPILNWTLYTWGIPTLCLVGAALGLERSAPERGDGLGFAPQLLRLLAMGTGFALVNVEVSHAFQNTGPVELGGNTMIQGMVRSLAWGGWGLFLLLLGLGVNSRVTRFVGFAFMLLAAGKVFIYDLWAMPGFVRVGSLIGLGVTLLVSAVLFNRLVLREPSEPGES